MRAMPTPTRHGTGSRLAELVCVPPQDVFRIWPHVKPLIVKAIKRGGLNSFAPIEQNLLAERALLWVIIEDKKVLAAVVTQLEVTEWQKACVIVACGGTRMQDWLSLIKGIEKFAGAEGCDCVRLYGRKGWARMLPQYAQRHVILEKRIR